MYDDGESGGGDPKPVPSLKELCAAHFNSSRRQLEELVPAVRSGALPLAVAEPCFSNTVLYITLMRNYTQAGGAAAEWYCSDAPEHRQAQDDLNKRMQAHLCKCDSSFGSWWMEDVGRFLRWPSPLDENTRYRNACCDPLFLDLGTNRSMRELLTVRCPRCFHKSALDNNMCLSYSDELVNGFTIRHYAKDTSNRESRGRMFTERSLRAISMRSREDFSWLDYTYMTKGAWCQRCWIHTADTMLGLCGIGFVHRVGHNKELYQCLRRAHMSGHLESKEVERTHGELGVAAMQCMRTKIFTVSAERATLKIITRNKDFVFAMYGYDIRGCCLVEQHIFNRTRIICYADVIYIYVDIAKREFMRVGEAFTRFIAAGEKCAREERDKRAAAAGKRRRLN